MEEGEKSFFSRLKEAGTDYLEARLQLTRLQAFEKISKVTAIILSFLVIALLACFAVLFAGLMFGFLLADFLHSNALGFTIIGVVFILLLFIIIVKRESMLEKPLTERIIKELFEEDYDDGSFLDKIKTTEPLEENENAGLQ